MKHPAFLIFSGYNIRAIIALCRYFSSSNINFSLVAAGHNDPILQSSYNKNIILIRKSNVVNKSLFKRIQSITHFRLIYCPTTEYINTFVSTNKSWLENIGLNTPLPSINVYNLITNKISSPSLFSNVRNIVVPKTVSFNKAHPPCVLKPKINIHNGKTLYPLICENITDLQDSLLLIDKRHYFIQPYIDGKSYYLCGYLSKNGQHRSFWQENLLQQSGGKSIVLARESDNPGLNTNEVFYILHQNGYFGPLMIEFRLNKTNLYYIETNPRFWGPLQLMVDTHPEILDFYCNDNGISPIIDSRPNNIHSNYYAWKSGFDINTVKKFTNLPNALLTKLVNDNDIFKPNDLQHFG